MKTMLFPLLTAVLLLAACKPRDAEHSAEKKEPEKPSPVSRNDKGETVIKLDAEAVKRVGVKVEPLAAADFSPEAKGFGRVLDPAPLTALVSELATVQLAVENAAHELELTHKRRDNDLALARATLKLSESSVQLAKAQSEAELAAAQAAVRASALELERTRTLASQNNTSARALQTAEAAATKDKLAVAITETGGTRAALTAELAVQKTGSSSN